MPRKDVFDNRRRLQCQVGLPLDGEKQSIGLFVTGTRNTNGELLSNFAVLNDLVISNTTFQEKKHSLFTWRFNDKKSRNGIDYILFSRRWRTSITNMFSFPTQTINESVQMSSLNLKRTAKRLQLRIPAQA